VEVPNEVATDAQAQALARFQREAQTTGAGALRFLRTCHRVNVGPWGNPDPYFVSLDLSTARHPQTLLGTHLNGKPLTVEHGTPLRLVAPVKLGLKNIKAITRITYTEDEPPDYWAQRGYFAHRIRGIGIW